MGRITSIEYADSTCNVTPCCSGCELGSHCFARTLVNRFAGSKGWPVAHNIKTYFPERLENALTWSSLTGKTRLSKPWLNGYPRIIFLNDLGDTFDPLLEWDWLYRLVHSKTGFSFLSHMMNSAHNWLLLTKKPEQMVRFFCYLKASPLNISIPRNFWLGVSVTGQRNMWRVGRLSELSAWGAETLFVSFAPLVEPITEFESFFRLFAGKKKGPDWVIFEGESGPNASPLHVPSVYKILWYCKVHNIPVFFKQWGEWETPKNYYMRTQKDPDPNVLRYIETSPRNILMVHSGRKNTGRIFEGQELNWMPYDSPDY